MSLKVKKICHVVFTFQVGGLENMLVDIVNKQAQFSDVTLVIIKNLVDKEVLEGLSEKVKVVFLSLPDHSNKLKILLRVWKKVLGLKPTLIHVHEQGALKLFPLKLPLLFSKLVVTIHDTGIICGKELNWADTIYAISDSVLVDIKSRYKVSPVLNYNGIDFTTIEQRIAYDLNSKAFTLVQVSRLHHEKKGQDVLLQAISIIKKESPNIKIFCKFIGEGKSLEYLQNMVNDLGISECVEFIGLKPKNYIYKDLRNYDLLVQPSRYEGFGLTVAEGIAAKVPVLVSDIEGPMEVIGNGQYGYSFKTDNVESCKNAILKVIEDYRNGLVKDMAEKAYEYAYRTFNIERTAKVYAGLK